MKWFSSLSTSDSLEEATSQIIKDVKTSFGRLKPDLGLLFVSHSFRGELVDLWPFLRKEFPITNIIGCGAGGVIGGSKEIEGRPAVSLVCASLPHVSVQTFDLTQNQLPSPDGSPRPWRTLVGEFQDLPHFILISDPFSIDSDAFVEGLDFAFPNATKIGGLASGGSEAGQNLLINNEKILYQGAVGVALSGNIQVQPVVAQGCRPIGKSLTVTACKGNLLLEVDTLPPLKYLSELYPDLSDRDKELLTHSLFLGVLMDSFNKSPRQGDYLIRNIVGLDEEKGIMVTGANLREGQTIQFHLRDAETSHDDLKHMLSKVGLKGSENASSASKKGVVLFSCLGRGEGLYGKSHHDISLVKSAWGDIPVGGFFCNGEIGPVNGKTYLHGYTSSIGLIGPRDG